MNRQTLWGLAIVPLSMLEQNPFGPREGEWTNPVTGEVSDHLDTGKLALLEAFLTL